MNLSDLLAWLAAAPDGTLVPVDTIRASGLLAPPPPAAGTGALTPEQAGALIAEGLGLRRAPKGAAVRKYAQRGLRGVILTGFPNGRGLAFERSEVERFVQGVKAARPVAAPRPPVEPPPDDPLAEIEAFMQRELAAGRNGGGR